MNAQTRSANFKLALRTMLEGVGDCAIDEVTFDPSAHPAILNSTWDELHGYELVDRLSTGHFTLTGRGWTAALVTTGAREQQDFKQRIGTLLATLKKVVKGRKGPATLPFKAVVQLTGLSL